MKPTVIPSCARPAGLLLVWAFSTQMLPAQLPVIRLNSIFPPGGQVSSQFEAAVTGTDLDEATRLQFSQPGIFATQKLVAATGLPEPNRFIVTITSNAAPGVCETRAVGRFGISNPRAFLVGLWPETMAPATNTVPASAIDLAPDLVVNGRASPNTAAWFRFVAKKGQRLFLECLAQSIDSRMAPALTLTDSSGRELAMARTGGFLDFTAPADGLVLLRVADLLYRGGEDYFYRLALGTGPRVDFIFPPAGVPGTRSKFKLFGRNLPGGKPAIACSIDSKPLDELAVEIEVPDDKTTACRPETWFPVRPASGVLDGFDYRLRSAKGISNPVRLSFAAAPVVLEQEPNDQPGQAQGITPPCEVAGQFFPAGERDWFSFEAKRGDVFWIEVFSERLGLPTDPFVLIQRVTRSDKGEETAEDVQELYDNDTNIGDREFNTATRDPTARFEAKEEGTYCLMVRDLFNQLQASPRHVYRLAVRRPASDFRLVALAVAPKLKSDAKDIPVGVPFLRRGETIPIRVMAFRRDGFSGEIELSVTDPPPGLAGATGRIEAGKNAGLLLLTASDDAPPWVGQVKIMGRARLGDVEIAREARAASMIFPVSDTDNERAESRLTCEFTLALCDKESAPISITAAENKTWDAPVGSKLKLPLRLVRRGDFNAALKLKPIGVSALEALKEFEVDGKATNASFQLDLATLKLAPGAYTFTLHGTTTGKYRANPDGAARADAAVRQAEQLVAELDAAAKAATTDFDKASNAATEASAAAQAASEKLSVAQAGLAKSPTDEKLLVERDAAAKASSNAVAKAKSTSEARTAAEKAKAEVETRAKDARAKKEALAARAKELNQRAAAKEVTVMVYSAPITINVLPASSATAAAAGAAD
jgi:hypothetical protein